MKRVKLSLGAGFENLGGDWTRVDLDPHTKPKYLMDVRDLHVFADDSVDEIRAVDILEHLSYRDTVPALREWCRVLKPGAMMFIQVPAADVMMRSHLSRTQVLQGGDQGAALERGLPDDISKVGTPAMVKLAYRLMGGHFDGQYTRDSHYWYLNAHHALFDRDTIRWAANEAGLTIDSLQVNTHPNYQVWMRKP